MDSVFLKNNGDNVFSWESLGDVKEGRGDLGEEMPVLMYRLIHFAMLDVLTKAHGEDQANDYFRQAGFLAGTEFAQNMLDLDVSFYAFLAKLQNTMQTMKIGILNMEVFDPGTGEIVLTIEQDLDCSGLAVTGKTVCHYEEGFIAGILEAYTKKKYVVREMDCWADGDRVCRFKGIVSAPEAS